MRPLRIRLKPGIDPARAADVLRERIAEAGRVTSAGVGVGQEVADRLRNAYLEWVDATEVQLRWMTFDVDVITALHTDRYWHSRSLTPRLFALIDSEVRLQTDWLQALLDDLQARMSRATGRGQIAVLDTHILLHYEPPESVDWVKFVGMSPVRLVVPLRVIEELDAKKYARRDDLAGRARSLLPRLQRVLGKAGAPGQLREAVTLEVSIDPGPRYRPLDADEEILDTCRELSQLSGQPALLVTGDTGMTLRAQAQEIRVVPMPSDYLRNRDRPTPS